MLKTSLPLLLLASCAHHLAEAGLDEHLAAGRPREALEQLGEVSDPKLRVYERALLLHLAQDWAGSREAFAEAAGTRGAFAPAAEETRHLQRLDGLNGAMLGEAWPEGLDAGSANLVVVVEREPRTGCPQFASPDTTSVSCLAPDAGSLELRVDDQRDQVVLAPWLDVRAAMTSAQEAKLAAARSFAAEHPFEAMSRLKPLELGCRSAPQRLDVARLTVSPGRHVLLLTGARRREVLVDVPREGRALAVLSP